MTNSSVGVGIAVGISAGVSISIGHSVNGPLVVYTNDTKTKVGFSLVVYKDVTG